MHLLQIGYQMHDVEVLIGKHWVIATSTGISSLGSLFWKSEYFIGSNTPDTWRWRS